MQLIIAEKPSVAQTIAKALGATERKDGYLQGERVLVTWCIGHLVSLADAAAYDARYARWDLADLPIIPETWQMIVNEDKRRQFEIIASLMRAEKVQEIVCATNAGREGELIFRLVYEQAGCTKPVRRLWISSLEEKAILNGFATLKDGKEYEYLYQSALRRAKADWLVGINASRTYSLLYGTVLHIGRVQTPTLAMLAERHQTATGFKKQTYYIAHLKAEKLGDVDAVSERIDDLKAAEALLMLCHQKNAVVDTVSRETKTVNPPYLFDLTTLQREANRLLGYTAQQTLDLVQSLYEKRLLSYPRSDSAFLTADLGSTVATLLCDLPRLLDLPCATPEPNIERLLQPDKVSDHHAIIPTLHSLTTDVAALPDSERRLYRLVASRLLLATADPQRYETETATLRCAEHSFTRKSRRMLQPGWKALEKAVRASLKTDPQVSCDGEAEEEPQYAADALTPGMILPEVETVLAKLSTNPPKEHTEDSLLAAMETAGAAEMHQDVERKGLGTPATRAAIIEKLIQGGYVERIKKQLIITAKGTQLIAAVPETLKSPALTAEWENALVQVADGNLTPEAFMENIRRFITEDTTPRELDMELRTQLSPEEKIIGACTRCGSSIVVKEKGFFCVQKCGFALWKQDRFFTARRKELTAEIASALLMNGKVALSGLYSEKSGKTYDAIVHLDDTGGKYVNYRLEFAKR